MGDCFRCLLASFEDLSEIEIGRKGDVSTVTGFVAFGKEPR